MFNFRVVRVFALSISIYFSSIVHGGLFDVSTSGKVAFEETVEAISTAGESVTPDDQFGLDALLIVSNTENLGLEDYVEGDIIDFNDALCNHMQLDEIQQQALDDKQQHGFDFFMRLRTTHTLISWLPGSNDGMHCAKSLHKKFKLNSVIKKPEHLSKQELGYYSCFVVVGHRSELCSGNMFFSLTDLLMNSGCTWVVLANCDSGISNRNKILEEHELLSPARQLSQRCNIKVSGTKRPLFFTEVSEGTAFTLSNFEFLIRANPLGDDLWVDFDRCGEVDLITEAISNL